MKKSFDCVELQHQGGQKVQAKLAGMTIEEQAAYWKRRGDQLRKRKARLLERRKAS